MLQALVDLVPAEWRGAVTAFIAPLRWVAEWQNSVLTYMWSQSPATVVLTAVLLLMPALLMIAGMWATMLSMYTIPFRSGRRGFVTSLLMAWWDAGRCIWLYWAGFARLGAAMLGWLLGGIKFTLLTLRNTLVSLVRSPMAMLDWTSRRYFQPGMPWLAFLVLLVWSAVEATVFTFTLTPTLNEVFGGLTGHDPNQRIMAPLLWIFLLMLVAGSFACIQVLNEAIKARRVGEIIQMTLVESAVMFFEVIFLYRELVDAVTPWIAQQSGGEVRLGLIATLLLASFGWVGVRGMSWFLFGRFGTPALVAILSRQTLTQDSGESSVPEPVSKDMWHAPVEALKANVEWFQKEGKRLFELLTLPVLQLLAAALNFAVVVVQSRPTFTLPFKGLEDIAVNPFASHASSNGERVVGRPTPREAMSRIAS